jgi:hypothetical protein
MRELLNYFMAIYRQKKLKGKWRNGRTLGSIAVSGSNDPNGV